MKKNTMNTIIEKIRAEIERQLKNTHDWLNGKGAKKGSPRYYEMRGRESAFDSVLSRLSDLEKSEKPKNPVLQDFPTTEKEMQDFLATHERIPVPERLNSLERILQEQPVCEGLEEAGEKYAEYHPACFHKPIAESFKAGAKWMREQLMKEAVEGRVISNDGISFPVSNEIHRLKLMESDKVKLIIIKED